MAWIEEWFVLQKSVGVRIGWRLLLSIFVLFSIKKKVKSVSNMLAATENMKRLGF